MEEGFSNFFLVWTRQESNLEYLLRRRELYPFNYGSMVHNVQIVSKKSGFVNHSHASFHGISYAHS